MQWFFSRSSSHAFWTHTSIQLIWNTINNHIYDTFQNCSLCNRTTLWRRFEFDSWMDNCSALSVTPLVVDMLPWVSARPPACYNKSNTVPETPWLGSLPLLAIWNQASAPTSWNPSLEWRENKTTLMTEHRQRSLKCQVTTNVQTDSQLHVNISKLQIGLMKNSTTKITNDGFSILDILSRVNKQTSCTCAFEVGTEFEPFPDAALRMNRKCFLYILHANSPRAILALPEQAINEHLQGTRLAVEIWHICAALNCSNGASASRHTWRKSLMWVLARLELGPGTSYKGQAWPTTIMSTSSLM